MHEIVGCRCKALCSGQFVLKTANACSATFICLNSLRRDEHDAVFCAFGWCWLPQLQHSQRRDFWGDGIRWADGVLGFVYLLVSAHVRPLASRCHKISWCPPSLQIKDRVAFVCWKWSAWKLTWNGIIVGMKDMMLPSPMCPSLSWSLFCKSSEVWRDSQCSTAGRFSWGLWGLRKAQRYSIVLISGILHCLCNVTASVAWCRIFLP